MAKAFHDLGMPWRRAKDQQGYRQAMEKALDSNKAPAVDADDKLRPTLLRTCDLAVLSACDTNSGLLTAGQGIQSLQTALHSAGVRNTVTTLWRVDETATSWLMDSYYHYWRKQRPVDEALWQAKRDVATDTKLQPTPKQWMPFVFSSNSW